MAEFLALYRGRTVSEAELVAVCADERIVGKFFEELAASLEEDERRGKLRSRVAEFKRGGRED